MSIVWYLEDQENSKLKMNLEKSALKVIMKVTAAIIYIRIKMMKRQISRQLFMREEVIA